MKLTPFTLKTSTFLVSSYLITSIASASFLVEEGEKIRNTVKNIVHKHNPVSPQEDQPQTRQEAHQSSSAQESRSIRTDQGITEQKHESGSSHKSHLVKKVGDQDSNQLSLSDLVSAMSQAPSTWLGGWDVMSSYAEGPLNLELAAQQTKNPNILSQSNTFSNSITVFNKPYTATTTVQFGNPTFTFGDPLVQLVMPISSASYVVTDQNGTQVENDVFPANTYSILCQAPIKGAIGNTTFTSGQAIDFSSASPTSQFVIHVMGANNENITFTSSSPANAPDSSSNYYNGYEAILAWLSNNSNVQEVDYPILSATSTPSNQGSLTLTPKSCGFNVNSGFLSVYIQTNESGNPTPTSVPSFQPNNIVTAPVPNDTDSNKNPLYNSSIIFSQALMENYYLKNAISNTTVTFNQTSTQGITADICVNQSPKVFNLGYSSDSWGTDTDFTLEFNLDYSQTPYVLSLLNNQASVNWTWNQTSPWSYSSKTAGDPTGQNGSGTVTVNVSISPAISVSLSDLDSNQFSFNINIPSTSYSTPTVTATSDSSFSFGSVGVPPSFIQSEVSTYFNSVSIPPIAVSFSALNYFAEANILFSTQAFQANTIAGINVPGDLIIVGNINPSSNASRHIK